MNLIPLVPNWVEIVGASLGYVYASLDVSRRLSWHWIQESSYDAGAKRFGAWVTSFLAMPISLILLHGYRTGTGVRHPWDKPPRDIRKAEKTKELNKRIADLQRQNERQERLLELNT